MTDERTINVPMGIRLASLPPVSRKPVSISLAPAISVPPVSLGGKKPEIAGYELVRVLGRGGEGTVWEAIEKKLERRVAVKVHRQRASESGSNLWTEARVAARIGDPSIVTVLDVGLTLDGRRYYAMELVRGDDVADLLEGGPLPARRALEIAAEVARAVAAAHEHGVVHRDLKPRNVIIDVAGHARVVDFGIALDLRSGDHLAGMLAGSPKYMAPEQIRGGVIGPHTDIWSIGVMLFEMLTGTSPFERNDLLEMLDAIGSVSPGPPSARRPGTHRDVDAIVQRCLERAPSDRFPSAAALHESIRAVLEGHPLPATGEQRSSYEPRPSLDEIGGDELPTRDQADKHLKWSWTLASSPRQLWPYVSDTQRFNQAVGLQPMEIVTEQDASGRRFQTGTQRTLGIPLEWQEFPFEWNVEREHSKFRLYAKGPVLGIWNRVTFTPRPDGGTDLTHEIWVKSRNLLGRVASFVELDNRLARAVDRYYRRLDAVLAAGGSPDEIDAHTPSSSQRARVTAGVNALLAQGFSEALVRAIESHLLHAPTSVVSSLRAYELADRWQTSRQETVDALVHAANHGLLVPTWSVLCPVCRVSSATNTALSDIGESSRCAACAFEFANDLEDSMELVFAPDPAVRKVTSELYCYGAPAGRPHVRAQKNVRRRSSMAFELELEPGLHRVVGESSRTSFEILATATGFVDHASLSFDGTKVEGGSIVVRAGRVTIDVHNESPCDELFRVENAEKRRDLFTAASALTHPTFRALFADQLPKPGTCLPVKALAFVFVRLPSAGLTERLGDARACMELSRRNNAIAETATRLGGTIVPSALSLVAIAFSSDVSAVQGAFAIHESHADAAVAVHRGECVGFAQHGRLEFFGETLHRGEALAQECPNGEVGLSETILASRKVALLVAEARRLRQAPSKRGASGKHPKLVLTSDAA